MSTFNKTSRILGIVFIFQFVTAFSGGVFLKTVWFVPEDMSTTMLNIAANSGLLGAAAA